MAIGDQDIAYHVVAAVCAALTGGTSVGGDVEDVLLPPSVLAANLISFLPKSKTATTFLRNASPMMLPVSPQSPTPSFETKAETQIPSPVL